jgi:hypothetical protein
MDSTTDAIMGTDDMTDRKEGETRVWSRSCKASSCGEKTGKRRRHRDHPCCKRERTGVLYTANVHPGLVGHHPHVFCGEVRPNVSIKNVEQLGLRTRDFPWRPWVGQTVEGMQS